jgi:hypothetical protein
MPEGELRDAMHPARSLNWRQYCVECGRCECRNAFAASDELDQRSSTRRGTEQWHQFASFTGAAAGDFVLHRLPPAFSLGREGALAVLAERLHETAAVDVRTRCFAGRPVGPAVCRRADDDLGRAGADDSGRVAKGAWRKQGWTYKLTDSQPISGVENNLDERRKALEGLKTSLWQYAATHEGRFPRADDPEINAALWKLPGWPGLSFQIMPDRAADNVGRLLVFEPEVDSDERLIVLTNGVIGTMTADQIRAALEEDRR